jgi:hypothetical protein
MAAVAEPAVDAGLPPVEPALEWRGGSTPGTTAHLVADPDAFTVDPDRRRNIGGRGIVLLDDSYTTGATAQSAAFALRRAGAAAVLVLVLARAVRPGRSEAQRAYWAKVTEAQRRRPAAGRPNPCAATRCRWA